MVPDKLHTKKRRKGQGMVEFALILPILLLIIFAIVDFGWMVFNFSQLTNALREGLRYGSVLGFGGTDQYLRCSEIRNQIVTRAGLSGIRNNTTHIKIWYDDGRVDEITPITSPIVNATEPDTHHEYVVAVCGATDGALDRNEAWIEQDSGGPLASGRVPRNDDRIVIEIDVQVGFLTPFIRAMASNGVQMKFRGARTIFPDGEPVPTS